MANNVDCGADYERNNCNTPQSKRRKLDDEILLRFRDTLIEDEPGIIVMLDLLKSERYALAPLEIKSCNAADPVLGGVRFTKATCAMTLKPKKMAFANFFIEVFKMLKKFFEDADIPADEHKKKLLIVLMKFLVDKGNTIVLFMLGCI